jgi:hypothetical protein
MQSMVRFLLGFFVAFCFVWFFGGLAIFPDAPIRQCGTAYCGKKGQPHTMHDFEMFELWQTGLMFGWPLAIASIWWLGRRKS